MVFVRRAQKWAVAGLAVVMGAAGLVSPVSAASLTGVSVTTMSSQQAFSGNRVNMGFTTASTNTVSEAQVTLPAGGDVSPDNRALLLTGTTAGNYATTPDAAANRAVTGDLDIRAKVSYPDWYSGTVRYIISKRGPVQSSYGLSVNASNALEMTIWNSGGTPSYTYVPLSTGWAPGSTHWLRATHTLSSGVKNYYVSDDGLSWTSIGNSSGPTSRHGSNNAIEVGSADGGNHVNPVAIYRAELRKSIDGPISQAFDARDANRTSPLSWTAPTAAMAALLRPRLSLSLTELLALAKASC